jgi:hypothetical protein
VSLESISLGLEKPYAVNEELVAFVLARAFDAENEMVAYPPKLDLVLELVVAKTFAADGVLHGIDNYGLLLAKLLVVLDSDHTAWEAFLERLC